MLPTGIAEAGAWRYAFRYDLTHRYFPDLIEDAHNISETAARTKLISTYLDSVGAASARDVAAVFSWSLEMTHKHLSSYSGKTWQAGDLATDKGSEAVYFSLQFLEALKV